MLLVKSSEGNILNYNDCSLPGISRRMISKKLGQIDVLLTNFNHAGKLLCFPLPDDATIKQKLVSVFSSNFDIFNPKHIVPFASHHYYKAPESIAQNSSLLAVDDLLGVDSRIVDIHVGDVLIYDKESQIQIDSSRRRAAVPAFEVLERTATKRALRN